MNMKVQAIQLSEAEILRRFSNMEEKFPRREEKNYFPSLDFYLNYYDDRENAIRQEANKMMEFAGLGKYRSNIKFKKLDGAAGNISLNSDMVAEITVDEEIAKNVDSLMATLAHEICHKVLYKHGIYFKEYLFKDENEVYADLATFYVGFGDLTMKGYKVGNNLAGYLSPDTYAMAYVLMTIINQGVDYNIEGLPPHVRLEINKASKICKLSTTRFVKICKDNYNEIYSETFSKIKDIYCFYDLIVAILPHIRDKMAFMSKDVSDTFYNFEIKDLEWHKFNIAYHVSLFTDEIDDDNYLLKLYGEKFGASFLNIYDAFNGDNILEKVGNYKRYCPNCGTPITKEFEPREYHLVCPHCKTHFTIDGDTQKILNFIKVMETQRNKQEQNSKDIIEANKRLETENGNLKKEIETLNKQREFWTKKENDIISSLRKENELLKTKAEKGLINRIKKLF